MSRAFVSDVADKPWFNDRAVWSEYLTVLASQRFKWIDTPHANHYIEGLNPQNHAYYCRDALAQLLKSCPAITGLTTRIHGESGVPEGSYDFWRVLFQSIANCGRRVEINMHAKGMDQSMIDIALETKQPVVLSPKYWAEHFGMPYHQAAIRSLERPHVDRDPKPRWIDEDQRGIALFLALRIWRSLERGSSL